jgi:hypothetical protein
MSNVVKFKKPKTQQNNQQTSIPKFSPAVTGWGILLGLAVVITLIRTF